MLLESDFLRAFCREEFLGKMNYNKKYELPRRLR